MIFLKNYVDKSEDYIKAVREKLFDNLFEAGEVYQDLLKLMLDVPPERTGHTYKNIEGKSEHKAAAPDPKGGGSSEPPAPLSRDLINSIELDQGPQTRTKSSVYIKSDSEYVLALEFGNARNNLKPKPAWNVTLVTFKDELGDIVLDGFYRR